MEQFFFAEMSCLLTMLEDHPKQLKPNCLKLLKQRKTLWEFAADVSLFSVLLLLLSHFSNFRIYSGCGISVPDLSNLGLFAGGQADFSRSVCQWATEILEPEKIKKNAEFLFLVQILPIFAQSTFKMPKYTL